MIEMTNDTLRLDTLPSELLVIIFNYCSAFDFPRLSQVCKRFYDILREDVLWNRKSNQPLVTNQVSERFRERCNSLLCVRSKWRISYNWQYGRYEKSIKPYKERWTPSWLRMTNDQLWLCTNSYLCYFNGAERFNAQKKCIFSLRSNPFTTFALTKDFIITGNRGGSVVFWMLENHKPLGSLRTHISSVNTIDATVDVFLTGSEDKTVKLRRMPMKRDNSDYYTYSMHIASIAIRDRVWSLATDPTGTKFSVGSSGINGIPPLHIYDIQRYDKCNLMDHTWKHGAGILDMVWEDSHTLLTCGYDTYIRKWDLRTGKCVNAWADPTDATLYCISSDYQYTMITGTQFNSMAVLWDQRQNEYVQLYFMGSSGYSRSPVYSLQFDSSHLYCVTDKFLTKLKFSDYPEKERNYKILNDYTRKK